MGFNVMNYQSEKTVKLSDAYIVEIIDRDGEGFKKFKINGVEDSTVLDNPENQVNCYLNNAVSVKIPNLKTSTDQLKYNTFTHNFIKLDLDSAPETLDITLYETSDDKVKKLVNYLLEKNGYNEKFYGKFNPFSTISEINVYVLNNNLTKSVFAYKFGGLRLVNYDYGYSYDYKDSSLPMVSLSFSYKEFSYGLDSSLAFETTKAAKEAEQKMADYMPNPKPEFRNRGNSR